MTIGVIEEGRLCQDCALVVANGEDSCEEGCKHGTGLPMGTVVEGGDDYDSEFYVPFRPCPGCGTTLAGTWLGYVILGEPDNERSHHA